MEDCWPRLEIENMEKNENYYYLFGSVVIFLLISVIFYILNLYNLPFKNFTDIFYFPSVTFFVGLFVIYVYIKQREDSKRDAAKIILQEIRRAEDLIADYKKTKMYLFAQKIIATNSWAKNIHLFVGDLDNDELDKISELYSTGEYLDKLIDRISEMTLEHETNKRKKISEKIKYNPRLPVLKSDIENELQDFYPIGESWQLRLLEISNIQPIYNSTIALKLKKIAKIV